MSRQLPSVLAATIERRAGLECGDCGGRHLTTTAELHEAAGACRCECCRSVWDAWCVDLFTRQHADLITTTRSGQRIVTRAAFLEARRRMEAELAELESIVGPA